jgi:3-methyladenine DNA glycosylase AlkC
MTERFSLKDHLFNAEKVAYLASLLDAGLTRFDRDAFERSVMERMPELELKQRISLIAEILADHLDPDFDTAATQILGALPPPLDPSRTDDDFGDFIIAPFGRYVEDHGMNHYETAMSLLRELTMRFSMEGPVRPFINKRPEETLGLFEDWARDDNYHVRRLVSESTRPTLPWAPRIDLDIRAPLPLLDALHSDPTRYVTRSVANHLNDIAKIEPDLVIETLRRWRDEGSQDSSELGWMARHGLRTLIKRGHGSAMTLLGYSPEPDVAIGAIDLGSPVVRGGDSLDFSITIDALSDEELIVDYIIDFVKSNGSTSPKVFKLRRLSVRTGQTATLSKNHRLRTDATTYALYPGTHHLTVVVNGKPMAKTEFEVRMG